MKQLVNLLGMMILCSPALAKDYDAQRQLWNHGSLPSIGAVHDS